MQSTTNATRDVTRLSPPPASDPGPAPPRSQLRRRRHLRRGHQLRPHPLVELLGRQQPQPHPRLFQRAPLRVRLLRDLRRVVVPDVRVQRRHEHERRPHELVDPLDVRLDPADAIFREAHARLGQQLDALQVVVRDQRLRDVELKVGSRGAAHRDAHVVPDDLRAHHHHRLALRRVHLPGHDAAPGLVRGERELSEPRARAAAEHADVVRDLQKRQRHGLQHPRERRLRVVRGERFKLIRRGDERQPGELGYLPRHPLRVLRVRVNPGADRGAADRELGEMHHGRLGAQERVSHVLRVAAEFLPERDWHRVHEVRPANLHDPAPRLRLGVQVVAKDAKRGHQTLLDLVRGRDGHRGGERVVGRLRAIPYKKSLPVS
eukprot:30923-Pelagococcus_subviridis.AAC.1